LKQIALESFQWAQELWPILKQFEIDGVSFYKCEANHADIKNDNGRNYTSKQLTMAASSLSERPLNINHLKDRYLDFPENQVLASRYEDGVVECIIQVADPETNRKIESGEINHVSVEGVYLDESNNTKDTEYPTSLHFRALALLTKDDPPGDPLTRIFKEARALFEKIVISKVNTSALQRQTNEAQWTSSYVSNLPDSSFAAIEPGGKKDEEGKTTPRSLRHLPYKDANGKPDQAHVADALARLSQTQIAPQLKSAARKKLVAAAKELGMQTSMDEAFRNFKIAKEILKATLEDDDNDSDADQDKIVQRDLPKGEKEESQQNYASSQAVKLEPKEVPGAEKSEKNAMPDGPKQVKPEMNPEKNTPGLVRNPTAITNEHVTLSTRNRPKIIVTVAK
jgi:hypothetical protein